MDLTKLPIRPMADIGINFLYEAKDEDIAEFFINPPQDIDLSVEKDPFPFMRIGQKAVTKDKDIWIKAKKKSRFYQNKIITALFGG